MKISYSAIGFALLILLVSGIQESYSTHISTPILTIEERTEYYLGEKLTISGWVEYDGKATSDVLLSVKVSDPKNHQIFDQFVTSDSNGIFEITFEFPSTGLVGNYSVDVTSMCREQHREICNHRNAQFKISIIEKSKVSVFIPQWIKTVAEFWTSGHIDDVGFVQVIEFLVQQGIITIPNAQAPEGEADIEIPSWIKSNAEFWINGDISDNDFAVGLEWLINNGIVRV